eukprot:8646537-Ditylum_brightwellii.AAC.1
MPTKPPKPCQTRRILRQKIGIFAFKSDQTPAIAIPPCRRETRTKCGWIIDASGEIVMRGNQ